MFDIVSSNIEVTCLVAKGKTDKECIVNFLNQWSLYHEKDFLADGWW